MGFEYILNQKVFRNFMIGAKVMAMKSGGLGNRWILQGGGVWVGSFTNVATRVPRLLSVGQRSSVLLLILSKYNK